MPEVRVTVIHGILTALSKCSFEMKTALGKLVVDSSAHVIALDGRPLAAAPKVVELIAALAERRGDVLSKEALIERLWPQGYADDATLWQTVYLARKLLAKTGEASIETHPRRGYQIVVKSASSPQRVPVRAVAAVAVVAMAIIAGVVAYMTPHRSATAELSSTTLRSYNLGEYYLHQRTVASVGRAIAEFQSVVHDAPKSALGYAGLSQAEVLRALQTWREHRLMLGRAEADAATALRIEPHSAAAQTTVAAVALYSSLPPRQVDADFKRALALDEESATAHMYYGQFLFSRGDLHGAYVQLRRATDLDPSLGYANVLLAQIAYRLGDPHTAIRYAREALGFGAADKLDVLQTLGYAYVAVGDSRSALHAFRELRTYAPATSAAGIAYVWKAWRSGS